MNERLKMYREKYIENFKDIFDVAYEEIIGEIDTVLESFLNKTSNENETIQHLKELTMDFDITPFKWILHHIGIDNKNIEFTNRLIKSNPKAIVYKYFEFQDYGFNLLSNIYEKEHKRIITTERRAKLFNINTLISNEKDSSTIIKPKITTTFFEDHKYNYDIYDWGILTIYTKGEIWDNKLKRYVIPKTHVNTTPRSYSFSVSVGDRKTNIKKNKDGSVTTFDSLGNSETRFINGCIEMRLKDGTIIIEYPDGAITKQAKSGEITEFDFEGNFIIEKSKSTFWNKKFKQ